MTLRSLITAIAVVCVFVGVAGYSLLSANTAPVVKVLGSPSPHSKAKDLPNLAVDLTFSSDGSRLVAWQKDGNILSWDLSTGRAKHLGRSQTVFAMCGAKDLMLKAGEGGVLSVETLAGKVVTQLELGQLDHAAWSKDCSKFALAPNDKNEIELWDGHQLFHVATTPTSMAVRNGISLSADGSEIAAAVGSHSSTMGHRTVIEVFSHQKDGQLARRALYSAANSVLGLWKMVFNPRTPNLYVGSQIAGKSGLRSFETATGSESWHQSGFKAYWVRALAVSPDGTLLISGDEEGNLRLWNAATGKRLVSYKTGLVVQSVAFSGDGRKLAVALWDGTIAILDVKRHLTAGT